MNHTTLRDLIDLLTPLIVAVIGALMTRRQQHIKTITQKTHDLVNGRLDQAIQDIASLKAAAGFPDRRISDHLPPVTHDATLAPHEPDAPPASA